MKQGMYYFYVYILKCSDGSFYVGHTDDLEKRMINHEDGTFSGYTSERLPVELVWLAHFSTRDEAFAMERKIKNWSRCKKQALVNGEFEFLKEISKKKF